MEKSQLSTSVVQKIERYMELMKNDGYLNILESIPEHFPFFRHTSLELEDMMRKGRKNNRRTEVKYNTDEERMGARKNQSRRSMAKARLLKEFVNGCEENGKKFLLAELLFIGTVCEDDELEKALKFFKSTREHVFNKIIDPIQRNYNDDDEKKPLVLANSLRKQPLGVKFSSKRNQVSKMFRETRFPPQNESTPPTQ